MAAALNVDRLTRLDARLADVVRRRGQHLIALQEPETITWSELHGVVQMALCEARRRQEASLRAVETPVTEGARP